MNATMGVAHKIFVGGLVGFSVYGLVAVSMGTFQIGSSYSKHGELGHVKEDFGTKGPTPMWTPRWEKEGDGSLSPMDLGGRQLAVPDAGTEKA